MSTSTPSISHHKIRARPSVGVQPAADSPRTPLSRSVSGLYGSPGSSFRIDDENLLIFEFGSRVLHVGFAGESAPRCNITYSPELWRRVGDYRQWSSGYERRDGRRASEYELWDLDVRNVDLGLVEDRIEKLVREAEGKYLLLDNRAKRVALAAPSNFPRPLLSIVLRRLFEGLQAASVTILPGSIMSCVGAGVRSALVVDLGWLESNVSAVYEYKEVQQLASVRAGKLLSKELGKMLRRQAKKQGAKDKYKPGFEEVDDILCRAAWCQPYKVDPETHQHDIITIPVLAGDAEISEIKLPFKSLSETTEAALLGNTVEPRALDDHNLPLHQLVYKALLNLPVDIRNVCSSHIIFTGGISNIPGLKQRILSDLQDLVTTQSWDPIREYAPRLGLSRPHPRNPPLAEINANTLNASASSPPPIKVTESTTTPPAEDASISTIPTHLRPHDTNPIDSKLSSLTLKDAIPTPPRGSVRAISTLGAWAGASLVTNLRIRGAVEIERDRFASHGLVGGAVPGSVKPGVVGAGPADTGFARTRQSLGPGVKLGEKSGGWSLGVWA